MEVTVAGTREPMLVIAFMRVARYEQAYGFTYQRMQAQGYMLVLGWALILLSIEVMRRAPSARFAYHVVTATLAIAMASVYYNTDAWIVRRNMELYRASGIPAQVTRPLPPVASG